MFIITKIHFKGICCIKHLLYILFLTFPFFPQECQLKRDVKEEEACSRICNALENSGIVSKPPFHRPIPGFIIKHYAGPVQYEAHGLLHKNKDEVKYILI